MRDFEVDVAIFTPPSAPLGGVIHEYVEALNAEISNVRLNDGRRYYPHPLNIPIKDSQGLARMASAVLGV